MLPECWDLKGPVLVSINYNMLPEWFLQRLNLIIPLFCLKIFKPFPSSHNKGNTSEYVLGNSTCSGSFWHFWLHVLPRPLSAGPLFSPRSSLSGCLLTSFLHWKAEFSLLFWVIYFNTFYYIGWNALNSWNLLRKSSVPNPLKECVESAKKEEIEK